MRVLGGVGGTGDRVVVCARVPPDRAVGRSFLLGVSSNIYGCFTEAIVAAASDDPAVLCSPQGALTPERVGLVMAAATALGIGPAPTYRGGEQVNATVLREFCSASRAA